MAQKRCCRWPTGFMAGPFGIEMLEDRMCQPPNGPPELMKIATSQPTGSMAIPVYPYLNMFEK